MASKAPPRDQINLKKIPEPPWPPQGLLRIPSSPLLEGTSVFNVLPFLGNPNICILARARAHFHKNWHSRSGGVANKTSLQHLPGEKANFARHGFWLWRGCIFLFGPPKECILARARAHFGQNWHSRPRGVANLFFWQHLPSENASLYENVLWLGRGCKFWGCQEKAKLTPYRRRCVSRGVTRGS